MLIRIVFANIEEEVVLRFQMGQEVAPERRALLSHVCEDSRPLLIQGQSDSAMRSGNI